jgi:Flp pilus assembly protein TadG
VTKVNRYDSMESGRQRGGAVAELAVTMPFFFLLVIGAVDFGRMWTVSTRLSDAAYAGAAYGAQTAETAKDTRGIREVAMHELGFMADRTAPSTSPSTAADSGPLGTAHGRGGSGNGASSGAGVSDGSSADSSNDSASTEGKTVTVDEYEILVDRYCRCEDGSSVNCDTAACTAGSGSRRTYVRVKIGTNFTTIFDYPGIPAVIELDREARLRAR